MQRAAIRQAGVGQRKPGVLAHRALEELLRLLQRVAGAVVREIPSAQVQLIGLGVDRVALAQPLLLIAAEAQAKRVGQFSRDLRLQREHVATGGVEHRSPQLRSIVDIHELGADDEGAAACEDTAGQHGLDAEVAPDRSADRCAEPL